MINYILSSVRPFNQNRQYADLQLAALDSWRCVAKHIVYFNGPADSWIKEDAQVQFIQPRSNPPTIFEMLSWIIDKGDAETSIAIVNSDIVVGKDLGLIEDLVRNQQMTRNWAATSFRYSYDPDYDPETRIAIAYRDPQDLGLDIFIAPRRIWEVIRSEMGAMGATKLTIGRILWDNTVNAWFRTRIPSNRYINLTDWRVVFHPIHGDRGRHVQYDSQTVNGLKMLGNGGIPTAKYEKPKQYERIIVKRR